MAVSTETEDFEGLLDFLRRSRHFDFGGYKRTTLVRRTRKRMQEVEVHSFAEYQDFLEVHPEEFARYFDTLLINVSSFFRDAAAWEAMERHLGQVLDGRDGDTLRVWSAGCSAGQEAYTLAMVLAERMGVDSVCDRVKIYATDVDMDALSQARQATFLARDLEPLPEGYREKYFEENRDLWVFRSDLRRSVIFGRHDLVQDAPISRLDLLVCRNTLMYFNAETQGRIAARLHFGLRDTGLLFLGKAEMLFSHVGLFAPVDLKHRIFAKIAEPAIAPTLREAPRLESGLQGALREASFHNGPVAQVVLDAAGTLVLANQRARSLLGLGTAEVGRPFKDLELSYRPLELRSRIEQAMMSRTPLRNPAVEFGNGDGRRSLEVEIVPLEQDGALTGTALSFHDVTGYFLLKEEQERSGRELENAYEELQSSNEELETTNEELQSTVEELETTNEELQSTNEEMETMNEELQSTNEELQTINDELRDRTSELHRVNSFLESILGSVQAGVIVVDTTFLVQVWNRQSEDMWGLRGEEVAGRSFFDLDIGLPTEPLRPAVRATLGGHDGGQEVVLDAINRRGRQLRVRVTILPLRKATIVEGALLMVGELQ